MLIRADARQIPLKDGTVQCVITSPPYWGLRDYKQPCQIGLERTPEEYMAKVVVVFREVWRALRDDGTVWLNLGDSYASNPASGGEQSSKMTGGGHKRTPATTDKRTTGLNPKNLIGIPWRVAFALQSDGWYLRSDIIWHKPNPIPESVRDRPTKAHEYVFLLTKSERYYWDADAVRENYVQDKAGVILERGIQAYSRVRGMDRSNSGGYPQSHSGRNIRSVWTVATQPYSGPHFATFPPKLIEPMILAGAPKGGVVLDPFCGTGTVVMVARGLGRVGIGLDIGYQQLASGRIAGPLFRKVVNR